jgi:arginyl-tRNA--protein-N-Asp/Glu arginylyltransferase
VKITKAIYSEDCYKVYQAYQESVHKEPEKQKSGYDRFLCQSPLFDPANKEESSRDVSKSKDLD